jgi:hypothetical protein
MTFPKDFEKSKGIIVEVLLKMQNSHKIELWTPLTCNSPQHRGEVGVSLSWVGRCKGRSREGSMGKNQLFLLTPIPGVLIFPSASMRSSAYLVAFMPIVL